MISRIIHIDMDAFYASVEQRDHPELKGKPVAVGGSRIRGVVAAASYEARNYGIHSALPSRTAYRKCPELIFVKPRFEVYSKISKHIMNIFKDYTDLVEPLSLDEAYLDVTRNTVRFSSPVQIAREIRARIKAETRLTASAGISYNKFLAKVASGINKPDGITHIPFEEATAFLEKLPISSFYGIGKVTAEKMRAMNIHTGADLKKLSKEELQASFGKSGGFYFHVVRGEDNRKVSSVRVRKSVGAERTFEQDIQDRDTLILQLGMISRKVAKRLEKNNFMGRTLTVKLKYYDFEVHTRSKTFHHVLIHHEEILEESIQLLFHPKLKKPVRLLGISISKTDNSEIHRDDPQITLDLHT